MQHNIALEYKEITAKKNGDRRNDEGKVEK